MIEEYFESIQALVQGLILAQSPEILYDRREREIGFLRGDLVFKDGSRLHFREFVHLKRNQPINRYMYVFQYMQADGKLIFRYDDSNHFPDLPGAPHHKHIGDVDVLASQAPTLQTVLAEIEGLMRG